MSSEAMVSILRVPTSINTLKSSSSSRSFSPRKSRVPVRIKPREEFILPDNGLCEEIDDGPEDTGETHIPRRAKSTRPGRKECKSKTEPVGLEDARREDHKSGAEMQSENRDAGDSGSGTLRNGRGTTVSDLSAPAKVDRLGADSSASPRSSEKEASKARYLRRLKEFQEHGSIVCETCSKEIKSYSAFLRHKKCGEQHRCKYCSKAYASDSSVRVHERTHTGERPFKCPQCDQMFISKAYVRLHVIREHVHVNAFSCDECGTSYRSQAGLAAHMKRSHRGLNVLCETCGKVFKNADSLYGHRMIHADPALREECKQCGKKFKTRQYLLRHLRKIHRAEPREYNCAECEKTFRTKQGLDLHVRTVHLGEKPFGCPHCGKRFASTFNLKLHEQVHTGQRLYQCDLCGDKFTQAHCLKTHKKKVHLVT